MTKLHTLTIFTNVGGILALCCALTIAVLTASTAQTLQTISYFPSPDCIEQASNLPPNCESFFGTWLDINSLRRALEPQGVTFEQPSDASWRVTYPGGEPFTLPTDARGEMFYTNGETGETTVQRSSAGYLSTRGFIQLLAEQGLQVSLTNAENPILEVNGTTLALDVSDYGTDAFYSDVMTSDVFNDLPAPANGMTWIDKDTVPTQSHTLHAPVGEGDIVGIAIRLDEKQLNESTKVGDETVLYIDTAEVTEADQVTLQLPELPSYTFVMSPFIQYRPSEAVLVRLTGALSDKNYTVIPPEAIRLE